MIFSILVAAQVVFAAGEFTSELRLERFYRGNTHTHSLRSDGDSQPEDVIRWYRDHGYQFVVMTDHNRAAVRGEFSALESDTFKVVAGEEVSYFSPNRREAQPARVSVHVNSICATATVPGATMEPVAAALQHAVSAVAAQPGAVAQVNHPNYEWALRYDDLTGLQGAALMEIANQHPFVRNEGDRQHPPVEALWDRLLAAGKTFYGVASDDMHDLTGDPGYTPRRPSKGWIQVASDALGDTSLCSAISQGRFYSSTGVELESIAVTRGQMKLRIKLARGERADQYRTEFIGKSGQRVGAVRATVTGVDPAYVPQGGEVYVRARVSGPGGKQAWVQPVETRVVAR